MCGQFFILLDICWNLGSSSDTDEKSRMVKLECVKLRKWVGKVRMQCNVMMMITASTALGDKTEKALRRW